MSEKERESAARRKRAQDPDQPKKKNAAKPTYVATDKKKVKEDIDMNEANKIDKDKMKCNAPKRTPKHPKSTQILAFKSTQRVLKSTHKVLNYNIEI